MQPAPWMARYRLVDYTCVGAALAYVKKAAASGAFQWYIPCHVERDKEEEQ